jgi:hypothetical protein
LALALAQLDRTDEAHSAAKAGFALNKTHHRALGAGVSVGREAVPNLDQHIRVGTDRDGAEL